MKVKSVDIFRLDIEFAQSIRVPIGEISAAQNKIDLIKDNIRNLEAERLKINSSWNRGRLER